MNPYNQVTLRVQWYLGTYHKDDIYETYMHNEYSLFKIYVNLYLMNVSSIYLNDADKEKQTR